jgi:hypothetical protein
MPKGIPRPVGRDGPLQPSAFTTNLVEEAAAEALEGYRTAGTSTPFPPLLGGLSSFGSIYLSGGELKLRRGNKKPFPPERKKWPTIANDT